MIGIVEPEEFLLHARVMMRRQMDRSGGGSAVESWKHAVSWYVGIHAEICTHLWDIRQIDPRDFTMGKAGSCHLLSHLSFWNYVQMNLLHAPLLEVWMRKRFANGHGTLFW
jgi:hypothetical protein